MFYMWCCLVLVARKLVDSAAHKHYIVFGKRLFGIAQPKSSIPAQRILNSISGCFIFSTVWAVLFSEFFPSCESLNGISSGRLTVFGVHCLKPIANLIDPIFILRLLTEEAILNSEQGWRISSTNAIRACKSEHV